MNIPPDIVAYATSSADPRAVTADNSPLIEQLRLIIDGGGTVIADRPLSNWLQTKLAQLGGKENVIGMLRAHQIAHSRAPI